MTVHVRLIALALCLSVLAVLTFAPGVVAQSPKPRPHMSPVYGLLDARVNVACCGYTNLLTVSFNALAASNASIFFSVGTFIPVGQCCQTAFLVLISVDGGTPGGAQGLGCGSQTSQSMGTLNGISCFGRLSFTQGRHSVTSVLYVPSGSFTVERGPSTAILLQFD